MLEANQVKTSALSRGGRVFRFGDASRLRHYCVQPEQLTALNLINLWGMSENDLIVTPRPRSPLIEALFLFRKPHRRPAIICMSDGYIFRQNAYKSSNRRYGWLNRHVLADRLVVAQPAESIADICDDMDAVIDMVRYDVAETESTFADPILVLVAGNDPFFDLPRRNCVKAFSEGYRQLRATFGSQARIYLSSPNKALARSVMAVSPGLEKIGRIIDADISASHCIFVGSPSTVLHDQFLSGHPVYVLELYKDSGVERFCAPLSTLLKAQRGKQGIRVTHKFPLNLQRTTLLRQEDLLSWDIPRRKPMFKATHYIRELQFLVLINEFRMLLLGWGNSKQ